MKKIIPSLRKYIVDKVWEINLKGSILQALTGKHQVHVTLIINFLLFLMTGQAIIATIPKKLTSMSD